jgi:hypothetical protein
MVPISGSSSVMASAISSSRSRAPRCSTGAIGSDLRAQLVDQAAQVCQAGVGDRSGSVVRLHVLGDVVADRGLAVHAAANPGEVTRLGRLQIFDAQR